MKTKLTLLMKTWMLALCLFGAGMAHSATITATVSGNWSSAATWSGGSPGSTISIDQIVIPAGMTVTMDMDVTFNGLLASLNVSGTLNSSSNKLIITSGALSGNGTMDLSYLEVGSIGSMSYTGNLTVNKFVSSAINLSLGSQVILEDTLHLESGNLSLGSGSMLVLNTNSVVKVEDGALLLNGGIFNNGNSYDVLYVGGSKNTGIELGGTGAHDIHVQLGSATDDLTLGSDLTVNGTIHHHMGSLRLNGHHLTLKGDYMSMNNTRLTGSATSSLSLQMGSTPTSTLMFNTGAANNTLRSLSIDINSGNASIGNNLNIAGDLLLKKGNLDLVNASTLTMVAGSGITVDGGSMLANAGGFDGTASYNVTYKGGQKMGSLELSGSGLNNVYLDMNNPMDSVRLASDLTINGTLHLDTGSLHINGHKLILKGDLAGSHNGYFMGSSSSELFIQTSGGLTDTIQFPQAMSKLNNFSINTGSGSNVMLNSDLTVENLTFVNGGLTMWNHNLAINNTGSINGYGPTRYVNTKGTGSLMMSVNTSAPYVLFPVGTSSGYAPAYIQRNSGPNAMIGVSSHNGIWMNGTSGPDNATTESVVNRTWDLSSNAGVDVSLKLEWTPGMEVNSFDRTNAYITHYTNSAWDVMTAGTATTTGSGSYQLTRTGITSLSPFAVVDVNSAVGIEEKNSIIASLYPVPVSSTLNIVLTLTKPFDVEIYDAVGRRVKRETFSSANSAHQVDMRDLDTGVYFVKVVSDNTQSIRKIVKQ